MPPDVPVSSVEPPVGPGPPDVPGPPPVLDAPPGPPDVPVDPGSEPVTAPLVTAGSPDEPEPVAGPVPDDPPPLSPQPSSATTHTAAHRRPIMTASRLQTRRRVKVRGERADGPGGS